MVAGTLEVVGVAVVPEVVEVAEDAVAVEVEDAEVTRNKIASKPDRPGKPSPLQH